LHFAPVLPLYHLASPAAHPFVAPDPLEQMAARTLIGIEVAMPLELIFEYLTELTELMK
jgi:hypothetical protein